MSDSGHTASAWMSAPLPAFAPIGGDVGADVCVIGAGIAGLSTAYLLTRAGKSVVVVDDGPVGGGETGRTTAHLTTVLDDRYYELEHLHGAGGARLTAAAHSAAIDMIESIVSEGHIACDFERLDGYPFVTPGESTDILERELEAVHRAGLSGVRLLPRAPLASFDTGPCLQFPRQAQFHPLKYLAALAGLIQSGGRIFTGTHAVEVDGGSSGRVTTRTGATIRADHIVVATNTPINDRVTIHTKQAPYRTYVIALAVPRGAIPKGLYWDTGAPYHYVRVARLPEREEDLLLVGGEDHKTGQAADTEERFGRLASWARERFPMAGQVAYQWSGQVMEPVDGLAYIGRNPGDNSRVYIATGDSGNGITHGTIAGRLLADLILGRYNPWAKLYDPARKSLRAVKSFARENVNVVAQYAGWLTGSEVKSTADIPPGHGAVLRHGLKKVAVYRDEDGALHTRAAECRHLGCVVGWNPTEWTWDCPCHGSRYDRYGKVVNGPANEDLEPVELDG